MRILLVFCGIALIPTFISDVAGGLIDAPAGSFLYTDLDQDYRIYQRKLAWRDALAFCSKCYGSFATFENPAEAGKVLVYIYNISYFSQDYLNNKETNEWGLDRRYWFGLTDQHRSGEKKKRGAEGAAVWKWVKTPADPGTLAVDIETYYWYPRQPDHDTSKRPEHCGGFWNPGYHIDKYKHGDPGGHQEFHGFNDYPCEHVHYFICKKSDDATAPTDSSCTTWSPEGTPVDSASESTPTNPAATPTDPAAEGTSTNPAATPTDPAAEGTPTDLAATPTDPPAEGTPTNPAANPTDPAAEGTPTDPAAEGTPTDPAAEGTPTDPAAEGTPKEPASGGKPTVPLLGGPPTNGYGFGRR